MMLSRTWPIALVVVASCASHRGPLADAGPIDGRALTCTAVDGSHGMFGASLGEPRTDGGCGGCAIEDETGNTVCAAAYPDQPANCEAVCDNGSVCERRCTGDCPSSLAPDAGCTIGGGACTIGGAPYVCDPTCGAHGGCRECAHDEECVAEYGPGSGCQRHCGTCCTQMHCGCI
jgi:hypothetical protein